MTQTIRKVGVCGAGGTMGAGIAIVSARGDYQTLAFDLSQDRLNAARTQTAAFLGKSVERGKLSREECDAIMGRWEGVTDLSRLAECDLVIEAVFEDLEVKQQLLASLDDICPPDTIFASNTSTLSITEIAAGCKRQDKVIGLHFCLPAQLMKLIEVSPGLLTSPETLSSVWSWAESCGQLPVKTQDRPGFILNALLVPFNNDAIRAVEAGVAAPADIDQAIKVGLGYKMGPLELIDLIGLDTQVRLCEAFYSVTFDQRCATPPLLRRMVAAGQLGRKSGCGFFSYGDARIYGA